MYMTILTLKKHYSKKRNFPFCWSNFFVKFKKNLSKLILRQTLENCINLIKINSYKNMKKIEKIILKYRIFEEFRNVLTG